MNKKHTMPSRLIELEHELSAALLKLDDQRELLRLSQEENEEKRKDIVWTMGERAKLMDRVKQLEDIIHRASCAFFSEGSDKETAVAMLTILEESRCDTPISDSTPHNVGDLGMLCRRLERLAAVRLDYIKQLETENDAMRADLLLWREQEAK